MLLWYLHFCKFNALNIVQFTKSIVLISIFGFVCPIITPEPLGRFPLNFDWGTQYSTTETYLGWLKLYFEWVDFYKKNSTQKARIQIFLK